MDPAGAGGAEFRHGGARDVAMEHIGNMASGRTHMRGLSETHPGRRNSTRYNQTFLKRT